MGDTLDARYFRMTDGTVRRVRALCDDDPRPSPRVDEEAYAALVTWERDYVSPDKVNEVPDVLWETTTRWAVPGDVDAALVTRYVAMVHPDAVVFVGGLTRNSYDGSIGLDETPTAGCRYVGLAVMTRESWDKANPGVAPERVRVAELVRGEVERYSAWATGDVVEWVIEDGAGVVLDSCGGYIGEADYAMTAGVEALDAGAVEITEAEYDDAL